MTCGSPTGCHCSPSSRRMTNSNWCDPKTNFELPKLVQPKTLTILPSAPHSRTSSLPLEPPNQFSSLFSDVSYRVTENAQTSEKTLFPKLKITNDLN